MKRLLRRLYCKIHHIPYKLDDEWYNYMAMTKYGLTNGLIDIFDKDNRYIDPKLHNIVNVLFRTKEGQVTCKYKIVKTYRTVGSDWLYASDNIKVNLVFVKFVENISFDEMKERLIALKRQNCMVSETCTECRRNNEENCCHEISSIISELEKEK